MGMNTVDERIDVLDWVRGVEGVRRFPKARR